MWSQDETLLMKVCVYITVFVFVTSNSKQVVKHPQLDHSHESKWDNSDKVYIQYTFFIYKRFF